MGVLIGTVAAAVVGALLLKIRPVPELDYDEEAEGAGLTAAPGLSGD